MWRPKTYRITVRGYLEESFSERLAGMRITACTGKDQEPVTILEGELVDQAELSGVLNTLHNLHLPILRVAEIEDESRTGITTRNEEEEDENST